MKINKKHKLYFRDQVTQSVRRLDKASPIIYAFVIKHFLENDGQKEHQELNKDVKSWKEYKPVQLPLPEEYHQEFKKLSRTKGLVISYNSSWLPLANLYHL